MKWQTTDKENELDKVQVFVLKPYNHKQLAAFYEVSWGTLKNWVRKHENDFGKRIGHFYSIAQVRKILRLFGIPKRFKHSVQEIDELFKE